MAASSAFDLVRAAEALLEQAKQLAAVTKPGVDDNELELRRSIAQTAKKIASETAPKMDVVKADWIISEVAAWNIFIDWKAFDHIPLEGHISIPDLARALNAQESLIGKFPHLTHRISPLYLSTNPVSSLCAVAIGNGMKPFSHWPEYFRAYGRREPPGQTHTPFAFGWGHAALPPWEVKALHPEYATLFARSMRSREIVGGDTVVTGQGALYDFGWVGREARGMGMGRWRWWMSGDRREVICEAREGGAAGKLEGVVMMEHDFHEEQPVKGALVYILRRILLDYSDTLAYGILRRLANALPADNPKARVLIMEERLLDTPTPQNCIVDLVMLNLGGKLRNEAIYRELAAAAGLKVVGYYTWGKDSNSVVECARA
ncbi:hypothetical protein NEMBOFW57_010814 [Staphylotrichum longicolle]|uniref:O-methyltransferase C-terminal domain-containing protein n=1 Tax=Staphylotrichum longicolle TaxID=669026 RepID=A0AAD4ENF7_9PEZI|nr:hypothetical protein NEMBOFW57_010814 [Staphylotrichum longicolle]